MTRRDRDRRTGQPMGLRKAFRARDPLRLLSTKNVLVWPFGAYVLFFSRDSLSILKKHTLPKVLIWVEGIGQPFPSPGLNKWGSFTLWLNPEKEVGVKWEKF